MLFDYDNEDARSIYDYAKKLEGKTFNDILEEYNESDQKLYHNSKYGTIKIHEELADCKVVSKKAKGQLGVTLERFYFGYEPNGKQEADFEKTGIELKQTPIDLKKNGKYTAGERLSITNISYKNPIEPDFEKSHVWEKTQKMLLVHYLRDKTKDSLDYEIKFVNMFTPPESDLKIIKQDYDKINAKIVAGKAHELSESDTMYLGACTKGSTAAKSMQPQYYGNHEKARKRNFCFKRQYMDYVLNEYVLQNSVPCESIFKDEIIDENISFEEQIVQMIDAYKGKSDRELCHIFSRDYNNNKSQWIDLAYRMLGIKSNKAEELIKANIKVKTIRIEKNGSIRESMPLPSFKFKEFVQEDWEESQFCRYFEETRFLFVVFKKVDNEYVLQGAQLWNMPASDLYGDAYEGWKAIQDKAKEGIKFTVTNNSKGDTIVTNDLPKHEDNRILHVRPHTTKSAYLLSNGFSKGDIEKDADQLPNGEWMTKQSFWLNNSYVINQIKDL